MSFVQSLRRATAPDHDRVDARYGRYDLSDAADYRRLLAAHGRALPGVEAALAAMPGLPHWRPRAPALAADLAALGDLPPEPLPYAVADEAEAWGALYVVEGSRLGGQLLARAVAAGLPAAYLGARHEPGEWRTLLAALDARAAEADAAWRERALAGARACFALYDRVADA